MMDYGNIVNKRKQTAEEKFFHKPASYRTLTEMAYDARGHQVAQLISVIGESIQARQVGVAANLCEEAIGVLTGLKAFLTDGRCN